ncbi:unnamed protein product [Hydatigera taeniaeformis]|uniref:Uncharacterized protein n=1 Tax=Hydatigena taeniaeformis TaxID=6205 RepID=A0A0R3WLJ1_HYDTA|nr:unnamed protein product [Hydatigera taeniaeformis]
MQEIMKWADLDRGAKSTLVFAAVADMEAIGDWTSIPSGPSTDIKVTLVVEKRLLPSSQSWNCIRFPKILLHSSESFQHTPNPISSHQRGPLSITRAYG